MWGGYDLKNNIILTIIIILIFALAVVAGRVRGDGQIEQNNELRRVFKK